jgi:hypothetical protein
LPEVGLVAKSPAGLISALFLEDFSSVGFDISPHSLLRKGIKQISCVEIASDLWIAAQPVQKPVREPSNRSLLTPSWLRIASWKLQSGGSRISYCRYEHSNLKHSSARLTGPRRVSGSTLCATANGGFLKSIRRATHLRRSPLGRLQTIRLRPRTRPPRSRRVPRIQAGSHQFE